MSSHHRIAPSGGVPPAPPPPVLSSRSRGSRRSRSRSPQNHRSSRYRREDSRERDRGRRRSTSPYRGSSSSSNRQAESFRVKAEPLSPMPIATHNQSSLSNAPAALQQSISLIGDGVPPITRRIIDPNDLKMPRRAEEGVRPIFERPDVKEGILRRMRLEDSEDLHQIAPPPVQELPQQQQRVIAIIREPMPIDLIENYRGAGLPILKESSSSGYSSSRHSHLQPVSPEALRPSNNGPGNYARSLSPVRARDRARRLSRERSLELKQELYREREREVRERELHLREREREHQDVRDRNHLSRDRERPERYHQPANPSIRPRSRSPVPVRIRRSRSRSRTPSPMPAEVRRQLIAERDLRNKLSRPLSKQPSSNKFDSEHDFRASGSSSRGGRPFSRGINRGRGFPRGSRPRAREDSHSRSRGFWEHDMFERDNLDQSGGDSKPNKD